MVSHRKMGRVLALQGHAEEALRSYRSALSLAQALATKTPAKVPWQNLAQAQSDVGDTLLALAHLDEALEAHRTALALYQQLAAGDGATPEQKNDLATAYNQIGNVLIAEGGARGRGPQKLPLEH